VSSLNASTAASLAGQGVAYAGAIAAAARDHGLDPALLAAIAAQETGGPDTNAGRNVVGDGGHGHGLFQIDDRSHAFAGTPAAMDPRRNAEYAARMLSGLIRRYGSVRRGLSAYNAGDPDATGTLTRWSDGATLGYADSVLRHEQRIAGGAAQSARDDLPSAVYSINALSSQVASLPALSLPPAAHIRSYRDVAGDAVDSTQDTD
jgi:hypothetical protein